MKTLLALIALSGSAYAAPPEIFWKALHQVESGGRHGRILGDYVNGQPQPSDPCKLHGLFSVTRPYLERIIRYKT
jgi:hypothetical protein